MSDFLNNLAARSLSLADAVQPRNRSLFEPQAAEANKAAGFSVHLSAEDRAAREDEPSSRRVLESSESSASTLEQSTRLNSITSSLKPSAEAAAARPDDRESTYPVSIPPEALELSRPSVLDATVARSPATDRPNLLTIKGDFAPQISDKRESRATVVPNVRLMVDEKTKPLEAQLLADVARAKKGYASPDETASPARTIMRAQGAGVPKLPIVNLPLLPAVAQPSQEIKITIGRVDVRAVMPAQPAPRSQPPARFAPTSLDDYLRERSGGRR